jgi:hypothetical protein
MKPWLFRSIGVLIGLALMAFAWSAPKPAPTPQTVLWAVVRVDGSMARGSGAVASAALGADGTYEVVFGRDVSGCAYAAVGGQDTTFPADDSISIGVAPRAGNTNAVYLIEWDGVLGRDSYSSGFHLIVTC